MANMRTVAESDLAITLEDAVNGFGWPIAVTDPDGNTANVNGQSGDIAELIDPDTGQAVSGRLAHVAIRISSLAAAGLGIPVGVAESSRKPWLFDFTDINGHDFTLEVRRSLPDRTLGIVTCILGAYRAA